MDINLYNKFLEQLKVIIEKFEELKLDSRYNDLSDLPNIEKKELIIRASSAIERIAPKNSQYIKQLSMIVERGATSGYHLILIMGIINSLYLDIKDGWLQSYEEILHSNLFADFIDMSQHLLEQGYKDAAAVISGSTLESHLRQLCIKNDIEVIVNDKAIKAETMNAELTKKDVYSKLDQKSITAWLDLRNKAAHGKYDEYSKEQVELLNSGIRDFITRIPA